MKKVFLGFIAVFITFMILDMLIHQVILASTYKSLTDVFRPEQEIKGFLFPIIGIIFSWFYTFIFSKGYEGKGICEGVRYGFYMGLMIGIPMAYGQYAVYPVPYSLALQWFLYAMAEYVIAGMVLGMVFGKQEAQAA